MAKMIKIFIDALNALGAVLVAGVSLIHAKAGPRKLPLTFGVWDKFGVSPVAHHYYQPIFDASKLPENLWTKADPMSGVDWNSDGKLALVRSFSYQDELRAVPVTASPDRPLDFFHNQSYGPADAEMLYNMIRRFKPHNVIEIGCGHSTRMMKIALDINRLEGSVCKHICIEPFEMPWLESLGVDEVVRKKVEDLPLSFFDILVENDVLFIDSTHVIRTGGDVITEHLKILPRLKKGVLIHFHDIFLPYEYPRTWLVNHRRYWTEQYLLQAFLAFNTSFEVVAGVNWLANNHHDDLAKACPIYADLKRGHGAFWMRKIK